jgi:hypothetical protein
MKSILYFLSALLIVSTHAATVTGPLVDAGVSAATTRVEFWPKSTPFLSGTNTVIGGMRAVQARNGTFSVNLSAGRYEVKFPPYGDVLNIFVPNNTNTYTLAQLATNIFRVVTQDDLDALVVDGGGTPGALTNNDTRAVVFGDSFSAGTGNEQQLQLNDSVGFVITNTGNTAQFSVALDGTVTANGAGITNIAQSGVSGLANSLDFLTNNAATQAQLATNGLPALWVAADTVVSNGLSSRLIATNNAILNLVPIRTFVAGTNIALVTNSSTLTIHGTATGGGTSGALTNNETRNVVLLGDLSAGGGQEQQMTLNESVGFVLTNTANASHFSVSPEGVVTGNGSGLTNIASAGLAAGLTGTGAHVASNAPTIFNGTLIGTTTLDDLSVGELQLPFASALAKTDASSNLVAAVAGTDYVAPGGTLGITNAIVFTDANGVPVKTLAAPTNTATAGQVWEASSASTTRWVTPATGGGGGGSAVYAGRSVNPAISSAVPRYFPINSLDTGGSTTDLAVPTIVPACTLSNLMASTYSIGAGTNTIFKIYTNGVLSHLTVTVPGSGVEMQQPVFNTTDSLTLTNGSYVSIRAETSVSSATVSGVRLFWSINAYIH